MYTCSWICTYITFLGIVLSPLQLLEVCRRLDAMEANGFQDSMEEAEVAALQMMVDVSLHDQYRPHTISTANTTRYKTVFSLIGRLHGRDYKIKQRVHQTNIDIFILIIFVVNVVV